MTVKIENCTIDGKKLDAEFGGSRPRATYSPEAMNAFQVFLNDSGMPLDEASAATATCNGKTVTDFEPRPAEHAGKSDA